ncbi:MAG: DUF748 domain-containing protein [Myxococcota bacterium]
MTLLFVAAVAVVFLVPIALRALITWQASERLGAEVRLDGVALSPIAGAVTLDGLAIATRSDPDRCWLCVDRVVIDLAWRSLAGDAIRLDALEIEGPKLRLTRFAGGGFDRGPFAQSNEAAPEKGTARHGPADVGESTSQAASGPTSQAASPPRERRVALRIDRLAIDRGEIRFRDRAVRTPGPLRVEVRDLTVQRLATVPADAYPEPAHLKVDGDVAGAPFVLDARWTLAREGERLDGALTAERLPLEQIRAYVADVGLVGLDGALDLTIALHANGEAGDTATIGLALQGVSAKAELAEPKAVLALSLDHAALSGRIDAPKISQLDHALDAVIDPTRAGPLEASATLEIRNFAAVESGADPDEVVFSASFDALDAIPIRGGGGGPVRVDSLVLRSPKVALRLTPSGLDLPMPSSKSASASATAKDESDAERRGSRLGLEIGRLDIQAGRLALEDRTAAPFVRVALEAIDLAAKTVRWPEGRVANFTIAARVEDEGQLAITGRVDPPVAEGHLDLDALPLAPFNPYLAEFLGQTVAQGTTTLASEITNDDDRLEASNRLTLHALHLDGGGASDVFRRRFGMPIDLALALLRDPAGDINLDFDLASRHADGVDLDWRSTIQSALRQAIVGAVSVPLKILARVRRSDDGRIASFQPESIAFVPGTSELTDPGRAELERVADVMVDRPRLGLTLHGTATDTDRERLAQQQAPGQRDERQETDEPDATASDAASLDARLRQLAVARADRVCRYFETRRGVPASRLAVGEAVDGEADAEPGVRLGLRAAGDAPGDATPCPEATRTASAAEADRS